MPPSTEQRTNHQPLPAPAISHGLLQDRVGTISRFHLAVELSDRLMSLNAGQLWALVAHAVHHILFPPRPDLIDLIKLPLPLIGALGTVHSTATRAH